MFQLTQIKNELSRDGNVAFLFRRVRITFHDVLKAIQTDWMPIRHTNFRAV